MSLEKGVGERVEVNKEECLLLHRAYATLVNPEAETGRSKVGKRGDRDDQ